MATWGFCHARLRSVRCRGAAVSIVLILAACSAPHSTTPPAAATPPMVDSEATTHQPSVAPKLPAPSGPPPAPNAAQKIAQRLFGAAFKPVFENEDEPAPDGYRSEWLGVGDFDANGMGDPVLLFRRDPESPNPRPPECALILTLATDDSHVEVYGVNPHEVGCDALQVDGMPTNSVGESGLSITQGDAGFQVSYQVSYDPKERRFVISQLSLLMLETGIFEVFWPLEGRGQIESYPEPEEGDPQPMEFPIQRVYFEDIDPRTTERFIGLRTSSSAQTN
jgi:hypothetical protein